MANKMLSKEEFLLNQDYYLGKIKKGAVFIYPTDTIYGLGCLANNQDSVKKIRDIKSHLNPLSIIAPHKNWVSEHLDVKKEHSSHLDKLNDRHTFILEPKSNELKDIASIVSDGRSVGVRMIDHWFQDVVQRLGSPLVSTSVNKRGQRFMSSIDDLDDEILKKVDFVVYEGEKQSRASKVVDLRSNTILRD